MTAPLRVQWTEREPGNYDSTGYLRESFDDLALAESWAAASALWCPRRTFKVVPV